MTYDSGWLKKRVSAAANEYNQWPESVKQAMKLSPTTQSSSTSGTAKGDQTSVTQQPGAETRS
jgi:hypothetical protein